MTNRGRYSVLLCFRGKKPLQKILVTKNPVRLNPTGRKSI